MRELTETCRKCGLWLVSYTTTGGKVVVRCQSCFNAARRCLYRKRHQRRKGLKPERLTKDYYVRFLLSQHSKQATTDWPQWLVELKREQLRLRRLCLTQR